MTHREFLLWLQPRLERSSGNGLSTDDVRAIRGELQAMAGAGALQPFASRLRNLLDVANALDGATVAGLAAEVRSELAPPRERTVVGAGPSGDGEDSKR